MKKILMSFVCLFVFYTVNSQNITTQNIGQISVKGIGIVTVEPDQANIAIGVETKGEEAAKVKKENDVIIANIIKYIKKMKISEEDFQTQRVNLYKNRDYQKKKDYYQANQIIVIKLKDLSKYEELVIGLIDAGANQIQGVEFKSSKTEELQTEARTKAVLDAKKKATDYANALDQKVGKAVFITDESVRYFPQKRSLDYATLSNRLSESEIEQSLAVGEIEISSNVSINFILE